MLLTLAAAAQEPASSGAPEPPPLAPVPYRIHGSSDLRWLGRWSGGDRDFDLVLYQELAAGDPERHTVTAHLSGSAALDLDRDRDPGNRFFSVNDTHGDDLTARLYGAYVDVNGVEGSPVRGVLHRARAGRQALLDLPEALFLDGLSLESVPVSGAADLVASAFAGVPSHLFESSHSGDIAAGAAASIAPWTGGRLRVDALHITDRWLSVKSDDDLLGTRFEQRLGSLYLETHLNLLELDARDYGAFASWSDAEHDLTLTARYTALLSDQTRRSIDLDWFTTLEATYWAYDQYEATAHKGLGEHCFVEGGAQVRELREEQNAGIFNHEFRRYHLTPGLAEWPWSGLTASVDFELWDASGERFTAVGGDVRQKLGPSWTASAGTMFQLYRYDALLALEREDVQVYWIAATWAATAGLQLRARLELEHGDTADYQSLSLGARIDF